MRTRAFSIPAGICLSICSGCADDRTHTMLVGRVEPGDAVIALVADGRELQVYVCGGFTTFSTLTNWSNTPQQPGSDFEVQGDGWSVGGDLLAGQGYYNTDNEGDHTWAADSVQTGTLAGLYLTREAGGLAGVVVTQPTPDATPAFQGAWSEGLNSPVMIIEVDIDPDKVQKEGAIYADLDPGQGKNLYRLTRDPVSRKLSGQ